MFNRKKNLPGEKTAVSGQTESSITESQKAEPAEPESLQKESGKARSAKKKRKKKKGSVGRFFLYFVMTFLFIVGLSARWVMVEWGDLTLDEVVFTLTRPLQGTDPGIIWSYVLSCIFPAVILLAALLIAGRFLRSSGSRKPGKNKAGKDKADAAGESGTKLESTKADAAGTSETEAGTPAGGKARRILSRWLLPVTALVVIAISARWTILCSNELGITEHIKNLGKKSTYIEDNYVDPKDTKITFPEKKRNLIYIFLESMEVSYSDKADGGIFDDNYIPQLTQLAKDNLCFAGDKDTLNGGHSLRYTTWTMGGMWAATSGLPLKIPVNANGIGTNTMNVQDSFFPHIRALGDILKDEGYSLNMMFGSDAVFGGRKLCFSEHGGFSFYDYKYYLNNGTLPEGYHVWWGFEDLKLFDFAKKRLTELGEDTDQPFDFTMLTVDTHFPNGYVCPECGSDYPQQYANVIHCSDRQVAEFVSWIQQQPWYENTTVILSGDHPTMNKTFCAGAPAGYERKVYTCYLNPAVEPERDEYREFATVDNFPTTLAAMGAKIEGDRLGLGTNLFSDKDTLIERDGLDTIEQELGYESKWMSEQNDLKAISADTVYGPYDENTQTIPVTLTNVYPKNVSTVKVLLRMYEIKNPDTGKTYYKSYKAEETEPGVYKVNIPIPTEYGAYDGMIRLKVKFYVAGVKTGAFDKTWYHLTYDDNFKLKEWYRTDTKGNKLTFIRKVKNKIKSILGI